MLLRHFKLVFFLVIFQSLSCQQSNLVIDEKEIYSLIIDRIMPLPPPPPPPEGDYRPMAQNVIDSIQKIKLNLAITTYTQASKNHVYKKGLDASYHGIIDRHMVNDNTFKITKKIIHSNKGHDMTIVEKEEIGDKKRLFKDYDQLIYLSNVEFNKNKDRAGVYVGRSLSGKLSGMTLFYLMKKEKGKWVIDMVKELSIS